MSADASSFMRLALEEARKGSPSPNPHVGAILVASDSTAIPRIIGRGYHARPGRDHAEVAAIREAGERARGATLYVTLEPCNHHGRTPPCTEAILAAGVTQVVVGVRDPNPHVCGEGNSRLLAAGIDVVLAEGAIADACARLLAPFSKHVRSGRPYVRLKLAASIDGRIAAPPHPSRPDAPRGVSRWITGPDARRRVHALRAEADAIAVGVGTALADDPELTPRDAPSIEGRDRPTRVVFDTSARLPVTSRLAVGAPITPTWILTADDAPAEPVDALIERGVRVLRVPRSAHGTELDLDAALLALGREGVVDLVVEGGAQLAGALILGGHVDEIRWFTAPIMLGDRGAPAVLGPAPATPDDALRFRIGSFEKVGEDLEIVLYPR